MKISGKQVEFLAILIVYLTGLYVWTLPIQRNRLPFGDVDASSHFTIGDYMVTYDRSIAKIPYPIAFRYGGQNNAFPGYLWYPPQYWANTGIAQILGGERIVPPFIFVAIFSSLIILSSFFLIRYLFGILPALLSSFLLIFSARDYMVYLFGQWPQSLSFAFTPLVLYSFYRYYKNYKENQNRPAYLYLSALFLSAQFFFHPQGLIASLGALIILIFMLIIKNKKIPFNFKHVIATVILFIFVSAAFAPLNVGDFFFELVTGRDKEQKEFQFDKLFKWYHGIKGDPGLPDFYFTYNKTHGSLEGGMLSWWTLPFVGVFILAYRRKEEDIVMLSWLISFYFLTRLVVFGIGGRDIRMFAYEAHIFYPIIAVGMLSLSSFARQETFKKYLKYSLVISFLIFAVFINGRSAYDVLKGQQFSIGRTNIAQYEAAEWIRSNLPEQADIYNLGTLGYQNFGAKIKWLSVLSQRHFIINNDQINLTDYLLIDYSDALSLRNQDYINALQNFERNFQNLTPIYNKNNIRVYKVDGIQI